MPRIQYCSDLHLEFPRNRAWYAAHPIHPVGDVLILAGDIIPFCAMHDIADFWDELSRKFAQTFWVPGNHEYYRSDIGERSGTLYEEIRENVLLVNNFSTQVEDVKLILSTMWTQIPVANQFQIQAGMSDFRAIQDGTMSLSADRYNQLYAENLDFLQQTIAAAAPEEKIVVATHHVPTFRNYPERFKGSVLTDAFATDLDDLIADSGVKHWIFGHHHCNIAPFMIGNTQLVTNQLGYVHLNEHAGFSPDSCLDL